MTQPSWRQVRQLERIEYRAACPACGTECVWTGTVHRAGGEDQSHVCVACSCPRPELQ